MEPSTILPYPSKLPRMKEQTETINIGIVDDHSLFRKGMINLIHSLDNNFKVVFDAADGDECLQKIQENARPHLLLLDINMPHRDGFSTVEHLQSHHPEIDILVVSMVEKEQSIMRMLKLGVKGYLSKDVEPSDLNAAIRSIREKGYYYTDFITGRLLHDLKNPATKKEISLTPKEKAFLELACSELTYKEIATRMNISVKTVDIYRDGLFKKFDTVSRVGLVLYAVRNELVKV